MFILEAGIIITIILILFLGSIVLANNQRSTLNKSFALLALCTSIWITANLLVISDPTNLFLQRLITPASIAGILVLLLFVDNFDPNRKTAISSHVKILFLASLPIFGLSFTDANVYQSNDGFVLGELYLYFLLFIIATSVMILMQIYKNQKKLSKTDYHKTLFLNLGIILTIIPSVIFGVVLPILNIFELSNVTPIFSLIFFMFTSAAILRWRLFDIRYVVFRLLGYTLSLGAIVLLFVFVAFNMTSILFGGQLVTIELQIYYVLTAIGVALLFGPIKKFVDKGTNRLFFQQSYSVNEAIGRISSFSTRSVDAHSIQRHSLSVIDETIKPEYAAFVMYDTAGKLKITSSTASAPIERLANADFLEVLETIKQKITHASMLKESSNHKKTYFELNHIAIVARLSTTNKAIGFLVIGNKKNGNSINHNDDQLLTLASNDLALALQNALAFEEIREFNATLQAKVNKATAALKRTNEKLVALDDTKDEFISMASHQLRTPLTSIKGYISMMLEGDLGKINDTQRKALEEAFNSSQRMVFLISDFLNISRIRTGKFVIEHNETDLNKIVLEEITQLRDLAGLRDQIINYTPPKNFPIVILDETKIRQVMMNFIDNAIFYTPKNGTISIVLEQTKTEVIFKVTDTGIGVPKNVQHRLFTKFFRAENARNARPDGTGLGLFMAQKIIDLQGGKVIFQSVENKGSTFGFRFPLKNIKS